MMEVKSKQSQSKGIDKKMMNVRNQIKLGEMVNH